MLARTLEIANNNFEKFDMYVKMDELDVEIRKNNEKELIRKIDQISQLLCLSLENKGIENQMEQMFIQECKTISSSSNSLDNIYME
jgi:hypothetical protein